MRPAVLVLIGVTCLAGCRRDTELRSKDAAERMSDVAADQKQAELWRQAAARENRSLGQFKAADAPVQSRRRVAPTATPPQPQPQDATLPAQQPTAVQVLSAPGGPEQAYSGPATIRSISGERVEIDLGGARTIQLALRVRAGGLQARPGDPVQVEWRARDVPENRMEILALRTASGDGIVSVLDGGPRPVSVRVALFRLTATQTGTPEKGSLPVEVSVGDERQTLRQGQVAEFNSANLAVGVVASLAVSGEDVNREEGNPFAIRLLAWPLR